MSRRAARNPVIPGSELTRRMLALPPTGGRVSSGGRWLPAGSRSGRPDRGLGGTRRGPPGLLSLRVSAAHAALRGLPLSDQTPDVRAGTLEALNAGQLCKHRARPEPDGSRSRRPRNQRITARPLAIDVQSRGCGCVRCTKGAQRRMRALQGRACPGPCAPAGCLASVRVSYRTPMQRTRPGRIATPSLQLRPRTT